MSLPLGELAALGTACCWTATSLVFAAASRRVGSGAVNVLRLGAALVFLGTLCLTVGVGLGGDAPNGARAWLALSAFLGLAIGDGAYFTSLVLIGPRRASLVFASAPIFTAVVASLWLGERLALAQLGGMVLTLAGIAWVVLERLKRRPPGAPATTGALAADRRATSEAHQAAVHGTGRVALGVTLAFVGACGQGVGIVVAKQAMNGPLAGHVAGANVPLLATFIRTQFGTALVGLAVLAFLPLRRRVERALCRPRALALIVTGALIGPTIGVWLSLVAIRLTEAAVAMTLMATVPVLVLPAMFVIHRERPSLRAVLGAFLTVGGVAMLVFAGQR